MHRAQHRSWRRLNGRRPGGGPSPHPRHRTVGVREQFGPPVLLAVAMVWLAGWAVVVRLHRGPLAVDRWVDRPLVSASAGWQHASFWLLDHQTPGAMAITAVVLGAIAARLGAWRSALAAVAGVAAEMMLLQWVLKPLVDRREIAPDPSFPSSYVGAACALAAAAVLLFRARGAAGRWLADRGYGWLGRLVSGLAVVDVAVVSVATIVTAGHLFSDVVAAIPWGLAVPMAIYWLIGLAAGQRQAMRE